MMFCGLEIKSLSQLLKNKQKCVEMKTVRWLTAKEVHTCQATSAELEKILSQLEGS